MVSHNKQFFNVQPVQRNWRIWLLMPLIVFFGITLLSTQSFAHGGKSHAEYNLKAAYLFQFTKFTQWPDDLFANEDSPIKICILGTNPFAESLNSFSKRTSQNRSLSIKRLSSLQNISDCQVVFISRSESRQLTKILKHIQNMPILSVSDIDHFAQHGGIIGFVPRQRKVGIEINIEALQLSGTKISSKLLELATLIRKETL